MTFFLFGSNIEVWPSLDMSDTTPSVNKSYRTHRARNISQFISRYNQFLFVGIHPTFKLLMTNNICDGHVARIHNHYNRDP